MPILYKRETLVHRRTYRHPKIIGQSGQNDSRVPLLWRVNQIIREGRWHD